MDESTARAVGRDRRRDGTETRARVADRVLGMLESLGEITDGFATDQLTHCLQTATPRRARRRRRRWSSSRRSATTSARPSRCPGTRRSRRRSSALRARRGPQDDPRAPGLPGAGTTTTTSAAIPMPARSTRDELTAEEFHARGEVRRRVDQVAFDPDGPTEPLSHFEPKVREVFARGEDVLATGAARGSGGPCGTGPRSKRTCISVLSDAVAACSALRPTRPPSVGFGGCHRLADDQHQLGEVKNFAPLGIVRSEPPIAIGMIGTCVLPAR